MEHQTKPTVMLLGIYHMANLGVDAVNFEADDVLSAKRQRELQHLIEQFARFNPNRTYAILTAARSVR